MTEASTMPESLAEGWRKAGLWRGESLGTAMARAAAERPDAPLHLFGVRGEERRTLADIHAAGLRLAGKLHALGLRPGEALAMQLPSGHANAEVFIAAAALGLVLVPIVHIYGPHELAHILADSRARALIVPDRWRGIDYLDRLGRLPHLPDLAHRLVLGEDAPAGTRRLADLPPGEVPDLAVDAMADALLLYTSGTTALPKGVRHSSESVLAELRARTTHMPVDDYNLSPWPSGHIAGALGVFGFVLLGRPTVMLESWDAALAAELVDRFRVTQMSGTPFHLDGMMEAAARDGRDLSSVAEFIIGATTVPPPLVAASEAVGIRCCRCYGSTEMPTVTQCAPADPLEKRLGTDGTPNLGAEVRIVDDAGADVPPGAEGEVAVRGAERFLGYTDPALDAASFLEGGWFLTGDIGRIDHDGYLAITDRKKDVIIRGGENISSREVEELLLGLPAIAEAAAIGMADARLGERVCAVLRLAEGAAAPTLAEIDAHFRATGVARQKTPEALIVVADFPRTPSGKVQKAELRAMLAAGTLSPAHG